MSLCGLSLFAESTGGQLALPNTVQEGGVLSQFPAVELVGVEDALEDATLEQRFALAQPNQNHWL